MDDVPGGQLRSRVRCFAHASLVVLLSVLAMQPGAARAGDERDIAAVLESLPAPDVASGFYVRATQRLSEGGRSLTLRSTLTAFPAREAGRPAWVLRHDVRRKPVRATEETVLAQDHRPIRGSVTSAGGPEKHSLRWRLEDEHIRYEYVDPTGKTRTDAVRVVRPVLSGGAGLVLFLRQLRPRTGTFSFELLQPDMLVQVGLVPMKLAVEKRRLAGQDAYVGEATFADMLRIVVVLDPESGALRSLETHVVPRKSVAELTGIDDLGAAEVHNQSAAALERLGDLDGALDHALAASRAARNSAYFLRVGALYRKLSGGAMDEQAGLERKMQAAMATILAADVMGEELESGKLAQAGAGTFHAMQAGLYEQAGSELLAVLAADPKAETLHGQERSFFERKAAEAFVGWAGLTNEGREKALELAGNVARGFAEQNVQRGEVEAATKLAALAALAYGGLTVYRPRDAGLWQLLGRLRYVAGKDERAIAALERSLSLRPRSPTARAYYGAALWRVGRKAEARKQLAILDRVGASQQASTLRMLTGMR